MYWSKSNHQDAQGLKYMICEGKLRAGSKGRGDIIVLQLLSGRAQGGKTCRCRVLLKLHADGTRGNGDKRCHIGNFSLIWRCFYREGDLTP